MRKCAENAFTLLHREVLEVIRKVGYSTPTEVQQEAIPHILQGRHVLIVAPTGSGKTEAVFFPIFSLIIEKGLREEKGIHALYITPLRALNRDIFQRMAKIASLLNIRLAIRHGDTPQSVRRKMAKDPPHILITTPETLQFLLIGKKMREHLMNVRWVVIDEVHELVEDKRGVQLSISLERLSAIAHNRIQRIGLSATIGDLELAKRFLGGLRGVTEVVVPAVKKLEITVTTVDSDEDESSSDSLKKRIELLKSLIEKEKGGVLIFTNTRDEVEILGSLLRDAGCDVRVHHGSLSKEERIEVEYSFKQKAVKALVCTSSLELGIDIGHVDLVVQYMSPRQVTRLVQRVGRAGHFLHRVSRGLIVAIDADDIIESAVIARRALAGELEKPVAHFNALDVLAHQIVGIALERRPEGTTLSEIYDLVTRSFAYQNLSFSELKKVVEFLDKIRLVRLFSDGRVKPAKGSIKYYCENASMIPDIVKFKVRDVSSMKIIGELDEDFVTARCNEGFTFVLAGRAWSVVSVDEQNLVVNVVPADSTLGALPAWTGEMIPVDYKVAREVGSVRRRICALLRSGKCEKIIPEGYPLDEKAGEKVIRVLSKAVREGFPVPDDKNIVIEHSGRYVIVHACLGSKVNEALGVYLSSILSEMTGHAVLYESDPYRVLLISAREIPKDLILRALNMELGAVSSYLRQALKRTTLYRWRLLHVARRFGIIPKEKGVRLTERMIKLLDGTPVEEEALREIFTDKIDVRGLINFLKTLKEGRYDVHVVESDIENEKYSPFAHPILKRSILRGTVTALMPKSVLVKVVKERLENEELTFICVRCLRTVTRRVKELPEKIRCASCGSVFMAAVYPYEVHDALKVLRKRHRRKLTDEERKLLNRILKSASLIASYGSKAALVLAGRGIGPAKAALILRKSLTEEDLLQNIIKAEKDYLRTKVFWD